MTRTVLRIRRAWWVFGAVLVILGILALIVGEQPTSLPVALPIALVGSAGIGSAIAVAAVQRGLARTHPESDAEARNEVLARQALTIAIALAPVLLGVALAATFGHRSSVAVGVLSGAACAAIAYPLVGRLRQLESSWRQAGHDVTILPGDDTE